MKDIVDQYNSARVMPVPEKMLKDAIDEVVRLRARIAELEALVKELADALAEYAHCGEDDSLVQAARVALEKKND